jgi:hypothetical protein
MQLHVNLVDSIKREIYPAFVSVKEGKISAIEKTDKACST